MNTLLKIFNEMLVEKNKVINLTAHKTAEASFENNIKDSLLFTDAFPKSGNMLDLGSGCGCPAVPLKIALPDLSVTMIDSTGKKVDFLNEAVNQLKLDGIRAVHGRIEDFAASKREYFDIVTARAVAELPTLLEYALPYLKIGGRLFAFKGRNWKEELGKSRRALSELGGEFAEVRYAGLAGNGQQNGNPEPNGSGSKHSGNEPVQSDNLGTERKERVLLIIKKIRPTPNKYPRGKNMPRLKPLV